MGQWNIGNFVRWIGEENGKRDDDLIDNQFGDQSKKVNEKSAN